MNSSSALSIKNSRASLPTSDPSSDALGKTDAKSPAFWVANLEQAAKDEKHAQPWKTALEGVVAGNYRAYTA